MKLTNVLHDRGGQTFAGISRRSNPGWLGWEMIDNGHTPPVSIVADLYRERYWTPLRLSEVAHEGVAQSMFIFAVHAGTKTAATIAQIVLGATPDGVVGPKTLSAINAADPALLLSNYTLAQIARYRDIVMRDRTQARFLLGWLNRVLEAA